MLNVEGFFLLHLELYTGGKLRKAFLKAFKKSSNEMVDINEPIVMDICVSCDLYRTLATSLNQVRVEIVAGETLFLLFLKL